MFLHEKDDGVQAKASEVLNEKMGHYLSILRGEKEPNYKLCKSIPIEEIDGNYNLNDVDIDLDLAWKKHRYAHEQFQAMEAVDRGKKIPDQNYVDLKIVIIGKMLEACTFCECNCGVNRVQGETGRCLIGSLSRASSWFLHRGEERVLIPSGTIFFSGCNFKCVFCQNHDISTTPGTGVLINPRRLTKITDELIKDGALNINYVGGDPIPNTHIIIKSFKYQDGDTTQLWNSNFYNTMDTLDLLMDIMDIWLPDFKYGNNECGKRLSGVDRYFDVLTRNLKKVHDEMVVKGKATLIIRHLVLPNHVDCCSIPIMEWISKNLPLATVNIMAQYRPQHLVNKYPKKFAELTRRPSIDEIEAVKNHASRLGITWKPVSS
ncbi:MAG: radical SAM protein [Promethearchaeota archaeon]